MQAQSICSNITISEMHLQQKPKQGEQWEAVCKVADGTFFTMQMGKKDSFPLIYIQKHEDGAAYWKKVDVYQSDSTKSGIIYSLSNDIILVNKESEQNYGGLPFQFLNTTTIKQLAEQLKIVLI